jgi:outer membrane protein assembly factor BamE
MHKLLIFVIGCASITLVACSAERLPGIYRIDIQQGNIITQDMLEKLKPGMSKQQVSFVLGTPLLVDTFLPDRWHYIYSFKPGNGHREQRTITVWFKDDKLSHVSGDVRISSYRELESGDAEHTVSITVPPRHESQGLLGGLMDMLGLGNASSADTHPGVEPSEDSKGDSSPPIKENGAARTSVSSFHSPP